ncbi:putative disease resistance protein RGA1 [Citrus clementina]|uniref:putative disease resistance protein RGA1 n=1 Tax=Citrus clementina TaxID=85681 RepID=UPI000CED5DD3|nr:putative disease resistance protein RGA1 [Citrus x clementina]
MADAIVSPLLEQLISFAAEEIKQQVKLVVGVEKEVKSLTSHLQAIQVVLDDAEEKQVKEKAVSLWLGRLKYASYDIEDVLDEWITTRRKLQIEGGVDENALVVPHKKKKVCLCFPGSCFGFKQEEFGFKQVFLRHDIADKIKEINEELHDIAAQKDMFDLVKSGNKSSERPRRVQSTSLIDEEEICGRVGERNELLSKLLCESSEQQKGLHIISIVGMGGIGKTTLAQLACNHDEVKRKFDKILWVCVSETFEEFRVAKAIVEVLDGRESHLAEFHSLLQHIYESIAGKSFLLVLDDVWDGNYLKWEPFYHCLKNGLHGSKILVTTRKGSVASMMGSIDIISVKELAEEECWLLFNKIAFFDRSIEEREKLEQIGQRIAGKCKGLPLAAKTIGSLMRSKQTEEEWKRILNSDLWKVEEIEKDVLSSLLLSYNDLPSRVKRCFSYCAVFPKDYNIEKDKLITLWMAQGYLSAEEDEEMETVGEEYFGILASRSFFQEFKKSYDNRIIECKMHDMVHDFARFVSQNECFSMAINGSEEPNATNSLDEKGIKKLPETLCELYNLEKLDISYCYKLEEVPEGIGKLINMKHLRNRGTSSLRYMPVGIGRLTGLRTLGEFHVSAGGGVDDVGEAKRLELDKKKYLFSLTLEFDKTERGGERRKNEDDQLLLEALRPPLDLKELEIRYYRGNTVFPSWMASLTNLKSLHLHRCENCEQLPPLGKLPSLENLYIWRMESVKRVGDEFLGIESDHHDSSSSSSVTIAFPKLKSLTIYSMLELEEWDYEITRTGNTVINIMPRLSSLTIVDCTKLKALPDHIHQTTTLKELSIFMCWLLNKRYRKGKGEDWPKISHIPNLHIGL